MKFISTIVVLSLAALGLSCSSEQDCCWSSKEACYRQHGVTTSSRCEKASYEDDLCYNHGIYLVDCDADCCSISKKVGIACP